MCPNLSTAIREGSLQLTWAFFFFFFFLLLLSWLAYRDRILKLKKKEKEIRPWFYRPYRCIRHQTDPRCSSAVNSITRGINPLHCFMWPPQHHQLIKANGSQSSTDSI